MGALTEFVDGATSHPVYFVAMAFLGLWPLVSAVGWVVGATWFARERQLHPATAGGGFDPSISVVVAAHNEEAVIEGTVEKLLELDWPDFEIIVVNDGSTDATGRILRRMRADGSIRLLDKRVNEGKAKGLNDALELAHGEIALMVDADGRPNRDALQVMIPHFRDPRVAAVTGNPRVANTTTLLAKLQAIEFSATVSVLRRAQALWGQLMTFSGLCTALRVRAVRDVGGFKPEMATEDIALTWQLERAGYIARYEPAAVFGMQVPETLGSWWSQRKRWARGLGQVLRRNLVIFGPSPRRRLWPIYVEATLSTIWSHLFFFAIVSWILAISLGVFDFTGGPLPDFWGAVIAFVGLFQISVGLWLDGRYDPTVRRYALWAPLYPIVYWMLSAASAVRALAPGFIERPTGLTTWTQRRV